MAIIGNPKKLAMDVAHGFQSFTPASLRPYSAEDLKSVLVNLDIVLRGLRGKQIPLENIEAIKEKNTQIRRLNQAIFIVKSYAAAKGIKV